jgi:spore coat polysaccharide biosynthesis protein SpsF
MNIIGVTQARIGSSRLPGKVLLTISGKSILEYHLERALQSGKVNSWVVATTLEDGSENICKIASDLGIESYQGSTDDVLDRFYNAVKDKKPDYIVRVTSDCPLIDPFLIDTVVEYVLQHRLVYGATSSLFPDGVDVEVMKFSAIEDAFNNATKPSEREHVTSYIRKKFENDVNKIGSVDCLKDYSHVRFTIDEQLDFETVCHLIRDLGPMKEWVEYANYIVDNPELFKNQLFLRNSGYTKSLLND